MAIHVGMNMEINRGTDGYIFVTATASKYGKAERQNKRIDGQYCTGCGRDAPCRP